ncbi:hypothetical protein LXL04_029450 [Taraxacum kok-saghyz]
MRSCLHGKMNKAHFSGLSKRAKDFVGIIHIGVCGSFKTMERYSDKYFISFIDDYSRYDYCADIKKQTVFFLQTADVYPPIFLRRFADVVHGLHMKNKHLFKHTQFQDKKRHLVMQDLEALEFETACLPQLQEVQILFLKKRQKKKRHS